MGKNKNNIKISANYRSVANGIKFYLKSFNTIKGKVCYNIIKNVPIM